MLPKSSLSLAKNDLFASGFAVQNVGDQQTSCTVTFMDSFGQMIGSPHELPPLTPHGQFVDQMSNIAGDGILDGFQGSAKVECDQNVQLLAITQNKQDSFLTTDYANAPEGICY